jgi:dihydroorotate dehydrogenase (NAD+) catalytic subunit
VYQIAQAVSVPIIGIGGIATLDDCMEFFVAGASAVQIGTANFYNPQATTSLLDALPAAVAELGAGNIRDIVGTLSLTQSGVHGQGEPTAR